MLLPISFLLEALLQWWLAGRKNRFAGWILPALHIVLSIVLILSFSAYSFNDMSVSVSTVVVDAPEEAIVAESEAIPESSSRGSVGIIGGADGPTEIFVTGEIGWPQLILAFLMLNIPTAVLIALYFIRRRRIRRAAVDKTVIQDL